MRKNYLWRPATAKLCPVHEVADPCVQSPGRRFRSELFAAEAITVKATHVRVARHYPPTEWFRFSIFWLEKYRQ